MIYNLAEKELIHKATNLQLIFLTFKRKCLYISLDIEAETEIYSVSMKRKYIPSV